MKILFAFIISFALTSLLSVVFIHLLYLLHVDLVGEEVDDWYFFMGVAAGLFTTFLLYLIIYLPVYLFNKIYFIENKTDTIYQRFLFMGLAPLCIAIGILHDLILTSIEARIITLNIIISTLIGFYIFIKTIKKWLLN